MIFFFKYLFSFNFECELNDLEEIETTNTFVNKVKKNIKQVEKNWQMSKKNRLGSAVCATFDPTIRYMFEGVDDFQNYPRGPFTNTHRMLLVDSILNNITFLNDQEMLKYRIETKLKNIVKKNKNDASEINEELIPTVPMPLNALEINLNNKKGSEDKKLNSCKGSNYRSI